MIELIKVRDKEHLIVIRELFLDMHNRWDLVYAFRILIKSLPDFQEYAPPTGCLLLAVVDSTPCGCVALHKLEESICEMKKLYIKPELRGRGFGKFLVNAVIDEAKQIGYAKMRLDTVPQMKEAINLYREIGFKEIEPYRDNPIEGALYMELDLKPK